jgi:hypothetical protein
MNVQLDGAGRGILAKASRREREAAVPSQLTRSPEVRAEIAATVRGNIERQAAWHFERIATAAYYLAERRGFEPGHEAEDWLLAEAQINAADAS